MLRSFRSIILVISMLVSSVMCFSQSGSRLLSDLRGERGQLQLELQSAEATEREQKVYNLLTKLPNESKIESVDGVAETSVGALRTVASTNEVLDKYKTKITEIGDGELDVTSESAKLDDYIVLALNLGVAATDIASGVKKLKDVQAEVQSIKNPMKAKNALASVKYSTEALKVAGEEIALQTKLVNNLIETIKASKNL